MKNRHKITGPFGRRRAEDGAQILYAKGFTDDIGNKRTEIVLTVMMGGPRRGVQRQVDKLCAKLNETWEAFYRGEYGDQADEDRREQVQRSAR